MASYTFQFRRGTAAEWASVNPVLRAGEPGLESDTGKMKMGDGLKTWAQLSPLLPQNLIEQMITDAVIEGVPGADGKSAYEVAVENGFVGTESEWLASLQGEDGEAGPAGATGPAGDPAAVHIDSGDAVPSVGTMNGQFYYQRPGV